jgi:hypothetical protein
MEMRRILADLVMSNVRLWTYKSNPSQPLTPAAITRRAGSANQAVDSFLASR